MPAKRKRHKRLKQRVSFTTRTGKNVSFLARKTKRRGQRGKGVFDRVPIADQIPPFMLKRMMQGRGQRACGRRRGQRGDGFGQDFYKGFSTVFKPGAQILGGIATAVGVPELGIPLGLVGKFMPSHI